MLADPLSMFAQKQPMITNLPTHKLGQLEVSALGFGAMSLIDGHMGTAVDWRIGLY